MGNGTLHWQTLLLTPQVPCALRLSLHVLVLRGHHACECRSAEHNQDHMSQMEFRLPAEALVPLPGSAPAPRPRPTAAAASSDPFDAFGSPPATAAAARDDFAELEAIGAPKGPAAAGMPPLLPFPLPQTLACLAQTAFSEASEPSCVSRLLPEPNQLKECTIPQRGFHVLYRNRSAEYFLCFFLSLCLVASFHCCIQSFLFLSTKCIHSISLKFCLFLSEGIIQDMIKL